MAGSERPIAIIWIAVNLSLCIFVPIAGDEDTTTVATGTAALQEADWNKAGISDDNTAESSGDSPSDVVEKVEKPAYNSGSSRSHIKGSGNSQLVTLNDIIQQVMNPMSEAVSEYGADTEDTNGHKYSDTSERTQVEKSHVIDRNSTNFNESKLNLTLFQEKQKKQKISCHGKNVTDNRTNEVMLVNSTGLLQRLGSKNETLGNCVVVMFYAPWCMFCAETAPGYSALARTFPQLDFLAIDAVHFSGLNARFGTIAVPNILIFHNSKSIARFNNSDKGLPTLAEFVANITMLQPRKDVNITLEDYEGPLSSVPTDDADYLLWFAWIYVITFSGVVFMRSSLGNRLQEAFRNFEEQHQHID